MLALSLSFGIPAKAILLPGTYFPGFAKNPHKCLADQVNPPALNAFEYANPVVPIALPTTPPRGGALADFASPFIN